MPITPYLGDNQVDPETKRIMGVAFEMVCAALKIYAPDDKLKPLVAAKIIQLAKMGERDPNRLCERVLIEVRKGA
jgi:hypothetical protein